MGTGPRDGPRLAAAGCCWVPGGAFLSDGSTLDPPPGSPWTNRYCVVREVVWQSWIGLRWEVGEAVMEGFRGRECSGGCFAVLGGERYPCGCGWASSGHIRAWVRVEEEGEHEWLSKGKGSRDRGLETVGVTPRDYRCC